MMGEQVRDVARVLDAQFYETTKVASDLRDLSSGSDIGPEYVPMLVRDLTEQAQGLGRLRPGCLKSQSVAVKARGRHACGA